jgi:isopentenyl phosphate kinase
MIDEGDNIVEDVAGVIGSEALQYLYDQDHVYVQNDALKAYYEIIVDEREYKSLNRSRYSSNTEG